METYRFYPPRMQPADIPYQVLSRGRASCRHELLDQPWQDRISVQDGIVFVTYSCKHCGRQLCQSLEEILPPAAWNGGRD
jgi:hypothetical protein